MTYELIRGAIHRFMRVFATTNPGATTMTTSRLTTSDLASVLSALDGRPRHPNTKEAAMAAIARSAAKLNRTFDEVLWLAEDLLDRRIDAADFRAALRNEEIVAGVC